ncbi:unnamed protein product [Enterobius vermicularis]|uniref:BACK domain-containing protein n=1 Tax=Enterobius vermicularis TaxID=51028 RepID=A0A0N4V9G0_ENTVE|nr:unnamed protein product [Enterobius vermicularis]
MRVMGFKSMLYTKLFVASPLLCLDKNLCIRELEKIKFDDANISEIINSWCSNQSAVIKLFVLLHCPDIGRSAVVKDVRFDLTPRLWSFLAAGVMNQSPFAAALVAEILKVALSKNFFFKKKYRAMKSLIF